MVKQDENKIIYCSEFSLAVGSPERLPGDDDRWIEYGVISNIKEESNFRQRTNIHKGKEVWNNMMWANNNMHLYWGYKL